MKKSLIIILVLSFASTISDAQEKAHQIYSKDGNKISYKTMLI